MLKRTVSAEFVTVLARLRTKHRKLVGALFYGEELDTVVPSRAGRRHVLHLLHRMTARPVRNAARETDLGAFFHAAGEMMKRRSLVFVVSDFVSKPGWGPALARLSRRHEVIAVRLYDPLEMELPDLGLIVIQDSETGEQVLVDTHDARFRARFSAAATRREQEVRMALRQAQVDALELCTDDDLADAIFRFADLRKRRAHHAAHGGLPGHLKENREVSVA